MRSTLKTSLLAALVAATVGTLAPPATAGTYDITSCDADPASSNNAWAGYSTDVANMSVYHDCPTGGSDQKGIIARTAVNSWSSTPYGNGSGARFDAAPGTLLEQMWVNYAYSRADQNFHVGFYNEWGPIGPLCRANDGVWCDLINTGMNPLSAQNIHLGYGTVAHMAVQCGSLGGCMTTSTGGWPYYRASLRMFRATVRVYDPQNPTIGFNGGGLATGNGWQRGSQSLNFNADDNAGVKRTQLLVDDQVNQQADHACDWSRPKPCGGVYPGNYSLGTASLSDGAHTVGIRAIDAADNTHQQTRTVYVDNHDPARPGLVNATGEDWSQINSFDLRVTNPVQAGDVAPLTKAHVVICKVAPAGSCQTVTKSLASQGSGQVNHLNAVAVSQGVGEYTAKVHLEDAAGNASSSNASDPVRLRFDNVAPGKADPADANGWVNADDAESFLQEIGLEIDALKPVSGIKGYSVTTDGSDPDTTIEVAVTHGSQGNWTIPQALPEGLTNVKARAISGAGVSSPELGTTEIKVDKTAPHPSVEGAPDAQQWQRGPVTLNARGDDQPGLSGMGASGDGAPIEEGAYMSYRVDGGEEQRAKGGLVTLTVPDDGRHTLTYRATDLAGNASTEKQVEFKIDRTAPETVVFEALDPNHPLRLAVAVADRTSGIAGGAVEMRRKGDGDFKALDSRLEGDRIYGTIDDRDLPAGTYEFRARAIDVAGNEATSDRSRDGSKFELTAPFRIATRVSAGAAKKVAARRIRAKKVSRKCRKSKRCMAKVRRQRRAAARRRQTRGKQQAGERLVASTTVPYGKSQLIRGTLASQAGHPITNQSIEVQAKLKSTGAQFKRIGTVGTDRAGNFTYNAPRGASRTLRFVFNGTDILQPAAAEVQLGVVGTSTMKVSRRRTTNGKSVIFTGRLPQPLSAPGKLVDLQAFYRKKWRTFAIPRSKSNGSWRYRYRFEATAGTVTYKFRVRVRREAAYPYELGYSRVLKVIVSGRR